SGLLRLLGLLSFGEDCDAKLLARAVRKHQRAPQLLVGMTDVQAETDVRLDGLVELRALPGLDHLDRLERRVRLLAVDLSARRTVLLAVPGHQSSTSTPIERAVPATTSIAASMSRAFRSGIF